MKDTILWLQLQPRKKSDGNDLFSSIKNIDEWIQRSSQLKIGEQARLYFQLLVEVNGLALPVHNRLVFLEQMHLPVLGIIEKLSKKYAGSGLPLAEDKAKFVDTVNTFWSEMAEGYKIIIDDLSESSFFSSIVQQKDLVNALYSVQYYLNNQLYSNYMLYSKCSENVWRDIHQVYHFAAKRKLINKSATHHLSDNHTIADLYKKILLFSLANPYHLSVKEMLAVWIHLDKWSHYAQINLKSTHVLKKDHSFLIKPYSDMAPFSRQSDQASANVVVTDITLDFVWGLDTKKLVNFLEKNLNSPDIPDYFVQRLLGSWDASHNRQLQRRELIEPVVIAVGASCIAQFLSQIEITPKVLKLDDEQPNELELTSSIHSFYQAYLMDESENGIRLKLNHDSNKTISPNIGEIIAIRHADEGVHVGFLRWMQENSEGDIEFGIEHLSAMAEPVQLSKAKALNQQGEQSDKLTVLDSFVFPGGEEHQFKPILFTHTFIEKFYNSRTDYLILRHKTGSIQIKLVQKVNEILGYSLYLFEKTGDETLSKEKRKMKTDQFEKMWSKV